MREREDVSYRFGRERKRRPTMVFFFFFLQGGYRSEGGVFFFLFWDLSMRQALRERERERNGYF